MKKSMAGACALALALLGGAPGYAQETGVAEIHPWVKIGRRTCMLDHFHDGSGSGANRAQAERAAIRSWTEFTVWEYGTPWGNYGVAVSKKMDCSGGRRGWSCAVEARPCRPY
jgi:hypothetical protein